MLSAPSYNTGWARKGECVSDRLKNRTVVFLFPGARTQSTDRVGCLRE